MLEDEQNVSPGTAAFWNHFYSDDSTGTLAKRQWEHRRTVDVRTQLSLLDHFEWFMTIEQYGETLSEFATKHLAAFGSLRVLHVGCGNSNFSDFASATLNARVSPGRGYADDSPVPSCQSRCRRKQKQRLASASTIPPDKRPVEVLNVDICRSLIERLRCVYPHRTYAVGDCCQLVRTKEEEEGSSPLDRDQGVWYAVDSCDASLQWIRPRSVELVFDKGTLDALLSAFPGEHNPNAARYVQEVLDVLVPGGSLFLISINSMDVVLPYILAASTDGNGDGAVSRSLTCVFEVSVDTAAAKTSSGGRKRRDDESTAEVNVRVETLGTRYTYYGFLCVEESLRPS